MTSHNFAISLLLGIVFAVGCSRHQPEEMSFFVISVPAGDGGNIGGLEGADAHCQKLAEAASSRGRQWRAYLSAGADGGRPAVNARDRIGNGPWFNSRGVQVAASLDDLHSGKNGIGRQTALIETGERTIFPHDMMTGSSADGRLTASNLTCGSWRSTKGQTIVGHSDRVGGMGGPESSSWNSAHPSNGCTLSELKATGGDGRFYCFATN